MHKAMYTGVQYKQVLAADGTVTTMSLTQAKQFTTEADQHALNCLSLKTTNKLETIFMGTSVWRLTLATTDLDDVRK